MCLVCLRVYVLTPAWLIIYIPCIVTRQRARHALLRCYLDEGYGLEARELIEQHPEVSLLLSLLLSLSLHSLYNVCIMIFICECVTAMIVVVIAW